MKSALILILALATVVTEAADYDIRAYGASPLAVAATNRLAIQRALDAAGAAGGGRVIIPAGTWMTGTIWLRSHVELHLAQGAILKGSPERRDYNALDAYPQNWECRPEKWSGGHLIIAHELTDVSLTGPGTVDGNGPVFFVKEPDVFGWPWHRDGTKTPIDKKEWSRPGQTVVFIECAHVRVTDLTLVDPTTWSMLFHGCTDVAVRGYRMRCDLGLDNSDGLDIDCCRNVTVSDCVIDSGDDGIAIRADGRRLKRPQPCENITIANCVVASECNAIRIGVGNGILRNVTVGNCVFPRSAVALNICAAYLKEGKNVDIAHLRVHDCQFLQTTMPFWIESTRWETPCSISDVEVVNSRFESLAGGFILGHPDYVTRDVRFKNCTFEAIEQLDYPGKGFNADVQFGRSTIFSQTSWFKIGRATDVVFDGCRVLWPAPGSWTKRWKGVFAEGSRDGAKVVGCEFPEPPHAGLL